MIVLLSCAVHQKNGMINKQPVESILSLTKDELSAYVVFNKNKDEKILMTNLEFHWVYYPELERHTEFVDTLENRLHSGKLPKVLKNSSLSEYIIKGKMYKELKKLSRNEIYQRYFDNLGQAKMDDFSEEEIKEVVAFLVESGDVVQAGNYSIYNIYKLSQK